MDKFFEYNSRNISYSITGNGSSIVFLHGFLENKNMWNIFVDFLKKSKTVITIDLPGFGNSDCIGESHSMDMMADVVASILEKEKIEKTVIAGHSMGGYVSLAMAERYAEKLSGVILFHSHASADNETAKKNRERTIEIVKNNHANFISAFIPDLFAECNREKFSKEIDQIVKESLQTKKEGIIAALAGMRDRPDRLHVISETNVPILFIIGKDDTRITMDILKEQIIMPKVSESLIMQNNGHMGFIENTNLTLKAVNSFVDRYSK